MKIYNKFLTTITLAFALVLPGVAFGVTQQEMEQARTIAAKNYLRYANDGSGYLDDLNPKTMAELEGSLKNKEKENIKAFKAIPVPTDYKDWDKEKLVEYWAVTAFQNKGLMDKGRGGRIRTRNQINKMTIAAPKAAATPAAPATASAAEPAKDMEASNKKALQDSIKNIEAQLNQAQGLENALNTDEDFDADDIKVEKATNYTWVYIMILGILVAIVIALVVYAANVFKKNGMQGAAGSASEEDHSEELQHLESTVADKDVEIAMLKKKLETSLRQNNELKSRMSSLEEELERLNMSQEKGRIAQENVRIAQTETPVAQKTPLRSIYLGRANSRGIFVRADRTLNIGNSIFVLNTSDGFSGTFKVADSRAAWNLALSNPEEYLETACTGRDLDDTAGATRIITESSGTAVFEGGCWRVIRKAKIRYE